MSDVLRPTSFQPNAVRVAADAAKPSRRGFLQAGALAGTALASLTVARSAHAAGNDTIKIGLVGCGGRGTGAAANALNADANVKLTAVADLFPEKMRQSIDNLKNSLPDEKRSAVAVAEETMFSGFEGFQKLLRSGVDVVLLCTPAGISPAAVEGSRRGR